MPEPPPTTPSPPADRAPTAGGRQAHRFRFAVTAPPIGRSVADWGARLRQLEERGFDEVVMADHFTGGYDTEPMVALTTAAMCTSGLRLRPAVLGVDYRHPVLVHRMAALLDVVSDGRLTLGMGAGWMRSDYDAAGLDYDEPGVRVDRLEEAIAVVKGLFGDEPFTFTGEHYRVVALDGLPKSVQRPHPPFFIGGGRPRVLRLAGREGDVVGVNAALRAGELGRHAVVDQTPALVEQKIAWIDEGVAASGRSPADVVLSMNCWLVRITTDVAEADDFLSRMGSRFEVTGPELDDSPTVLVGPLERIVEKLQASRERYGFSHVQLDAGFPPKDVEVLFPIVEALAGT